MPVDLGKSYYRNAFTSGDKSQGTRRALILVQPNRDHRKAENLEKEINRVYTYRTQMVNLLNETLSRLEKINDRRFLKLNLDLRKMPAANISLHEVLDEMHDQSEYRVLLSLSELMANARDQRSLEEFGISHLVTLSCDKRTLGWEPGAGIVSANVNIEPQSLPLLIVDVMLDIAMFYSLPELVENYGATPATRKSLSRKKAEYALRHGFSSFYGPITDGVEYFSFASYVRRGQNFSDHDCENYEAAWQRFIAEEGLTREAGASIEIPDVSTSEELIDVERGQLERVVGDIISRHSRGKQISASALRRKLSALPSGHVYMLVLAAKKPHIRRQRQRILAIMRRRRWRSNMWIIVPYEERAKFVREHPFLTFFRFSVG